MNTEVKNAFLSLMKSAMSDAERAKDCVFAQADSIAELPYGEGIHKNSAAAMSYASSAIGKCSAAEAIYYCNLDSLAHVELPGLFHQFGVFVRELQKNYSTNHSHQWTSIEFEKLQELFDDSICDIPIEED